MSAPVVILGAGRSLDQLSSVYNSLGHSGHTIIGINHVTLWFYRRFKRPVNYHVSADASVPVGPESMTKGIARKDFALKGCDPTRWHGIPSDIIFYQNSLSVALGLADLIGPPKVYLYGISIEEDADSEEMLRANYPLSKKCPALLEQRGQIREFIEKTGIPVIV